jgi:hypothetical protein
MYIYIRSNTRRAVASLVWMLAVIPFIPLSSLAQASGTIAGTVTDSSGAAIASAQITVRNDNTGLSYPSKTDSGGRFTVPFVPVGTYELQVDRVGFTSFTQKNIDVHDYATLQVNAVLKITTVTSQIIVNGNPPTLQTEATNLVQVIDRERVQDLPLNGRDILQLLTLNAGVSNTNSIGGSEEVATLGTSNAGLYTVPVSVNGSRGNGSNFFLDNAPNNDIYTNIAAPFPNPDAIQEVTVQTSTYDAQYGRSVGGILSAVTRSGTNKFHGLIFEYIRNYDANASNYFSGRDTIRRNQFGGTIGGPIKLGKFYDGADRSFFFFSYQGTRIRSATPGFAAVEPNAAMEQGNFSAFLQPNGTGAIHNPLVPGTYFPNNIIPSSQINPVAQRILQHLPTSTSSNYQVRFATPESSVNDDQYVAQVDHSFSAHHRLSMRYFQLNYNQPWAASPDNLAYISSGQVSGLYNGSVNHTWILRTNLLNQFTLGVLVETPKSVPPTSLGSSTFQGFGANVLSDPGLPTLTLNITGWTGVSLTPAYYIPRETYTVGDTLSWKVGRHNIRVGGDLQRFRLDYSAPALTGGSATFSGTLLSDPGKSDTGNAYAEFLLGDMTTWVQETANSFRSWNTLPSLFVQDDVRVGSRLTINAGLRWEPEFGYKEVRGHESTFEPGQQSTVFTNAPLGLLFIGDRQLGSTIVRPDYKGFAPRVGFAYQFTPNIVLRSAYGIFYDHDPAIVENRAAAAEPFINEQTFSGPLSLSAPYGTGTPLNPQQIQPASNVAFAPYGSYSLQWPWQRPGYVQSWNVLVEQQLRPSLLLRMAYVASKGTRLLDSVEQNAAIYKAGQCGSTPCSTVANENSRRPHQPIGPLELGLPDGFSTYNSLQITMDKRLSHGVSVLGNYTWSKSLDNNSYSSIEGSQAGPDPSNLSLNRAVSDFNVPQQLVASAIVRSPELTGTNRVIRSLLGGWQNNLIFTMKSGTPFSILSGVDNALSGVAGQWATYRGGGYYLPNPGNKKQRIAKWFNTSAFTANAIGTVGTPLRNRLSGPGYFDLDYSLFKTLPLSDRVGLQLRGELFNALNHPNLGVPNATANSTLFGQISTAGDPRIVQIAARIQF